MSNSPGDQIAMEERGARIAPSSPTTSHTATCQSFEDVEKGYPVNTTETVVNPQGADYRPLILRVLGVLRTVFVASKRAPSWQPKIRKLNDHPRGYPNLAAFLDSHENFMIYRRFGYMQSRILLHKQDELRRLEEELEDMDADDARGDAGRLCTRDDDTDDRKELMEKMEEKFCSYAKILAAAQSMMSFNRPARSDYKSVGNYMSNRKPLCEVEAGWILHKEDMVTLRAAREHAWLDDVVERFLRVTHCALIQKIFCSEESLVKTEDCLDSAGNEHDYERGCEIYYTPSRVKNFSNSILLVLILALLITPITIMYRLIANEGMSNAYVACIGVMLVATLAFSAVLALFTKAKRHELLGAAAA